MSEVLKVLLTGAAGQIGYAISPMICCGDAFGPNRKVHLVMLDLPICKDVMRGIKLELKDCAFPLVEKITVTVDEEMAFKDIDCAIMVAGAMNLTEGMKRADLLLANKEICMRHGALLNKYAKATCKVLMIANPANTNCLILSSFCEKIPKENFTCLNMLDHNRAKAFLARKIGVSNENVKKVCIWGNHSSSMVPDHRYAEVHQPDKVVKKVTEVNQDFDWYSNYFVPQVKERGAAVINRRKKTSGLSPSKCSCEHLFYWFNDTPKDDFFSYGVVSDGSYGIPEGIVFSFPCVVVDGKLSIVQGLPVDPDVMKDMMISAEELLEEKKIAGL